MQQLPLFLPQLSQLQRLSPLRLLQLLISQLQLSQLLSYQPQPSRLQSSPLLSSFQQPVSQARPSPQLQPSRHQPLSHPKISLSTLNSVVWPLALLQLPILPIQPINRSWSKHSAFLGSGLSCQPGQGLAGPLLTCLQLARTWPDQFSFYHRWSWPNFLRSPI